MDWTTNSIVHLFFLSVQPVPCTVLFSLQSFLRGTWIFKTKLHWIYRVKLTHCCQATPTGVLRDSCFYTKPAVCATVVCKLRRCSLSSMCFHTSKEKGSQGACSLLSIEATGNHQKGRKTGKNVIEHKRCEWLGARQVCSKALLCADKFVNNNIKKTTFSQKPKK